MVTKIYLVRHCQSMGNIEYRFQGRYDAEISPEGAKQLELLGLRFRNEPIDAIYTSPLKRARATAQAIAQYHHIEIIDAPGFIEMDVGEMENLRLDEVAARYPDVARSWDETLDLCAFPGGETMPQVYERVNAALDELIAGNPGKTIVVATHGGVLRNIYTWVKFGDLGSIRKSAVFGNTSVSLLEAEDGQLSWRYVNNMDHLPEEMRKPKIYYSFAEAGREPV